MASTLVPVPPILATTRSTPGIPEAPDTLIPLREVCRRAGIARQTIDRLERRRKFPRRIKIGKATRWSARAIQAWIDEQIAASER
jgi:predicted DNA-binding transcriptional regulator AlpA